MRNRFNENNCNETYLQTDKLQKWHNDRPIYKSGNVQFMGTKHYAAGVIHHMFPISGLNHIEHTFQGEEKLYTQVVHVEGRTISSELMNQGIASDYVTHFSGATCFWSPFVSWWGCPGQCSDYTLTQWLDCFVCCRWFEKGLCCCFKTACELPCALGEVTALRSTYTNRTSRNGLCYQCSDTCYCTSCCTVNSATNTYECRPCSCYGNCGTCCPMTANWCWYSLRTAAGLVSEPLSHIRANWKIHWMMGAGSTLSALVLIPGAYIGITTAVIVLLPKVSLTSAAIGLTQALDTLAALPVLNELGSMSLAIFSPLGDLLSIQPIILKGAGGLGLLSIPKSILNRAWESIHHYCARHGILTLQNRKITFPAGVIPIITLPRTTQPAMALARRSPIANLNIPQTASEEKHSSIPDPVTIRIDHPLPMTETKADETPKISDSEFIKLATSGADAKTLQAVFGVSADNSEDIIRQLSAEAKTTPVKTQLITAEEDDEPDFTQTIDCKQLKPKAGTLYLAPNTLPGQPETVMEETVDGAKTLVQSPSMSRG